MNVEKELESYGIKIFQSKNDDRYLIDFALQDKDTGEEYATVWGDSQNSWEYECSHPNVEYEDDETQGYCPICGEYCDWHYDISADDGYTIKERVPHQWHNGDGGIINKYIEEEYD